MELIIGAVLMLPLYLAAGITVARWQYNTDTTPTPEYRDKVSALEAKRKSVNHSRYCETQYGSRCDCPAKAGIDRLNKEIADLKPVGEPQMGTIVTWPTYILKRAVLKVYIPREKVETEVDMSSPIFDKVNELQEVVAANNAFYKDEKWQEIHNTWADLQAQAEADMAAEAAKKKSVVARAKEDIKKMRVPKGYEAYEQYDIHGRKIHGFVATEQPTPKYGHKG